MSGQEAFDRNVERYEAWFTEHPLVYVSELHAVRELLPKNGSGIEIGVGTGRFAAPFGIRLGVEPSLAMGEIARKRGIEVVRGAAEALPFKDDEFDFALMVTTVCFLDDLDRAFAEVRRILWPGGAFIIGFVDRNSPLGRQYLDRKDRSVFYRDATFYATEELVSHLTNAGFGDFSFRQTLFRPVEKMDEVEPVKEGYGEGSFVVIGGVKIDRL